MSDDPSLADLGLMRGRDLANFRKLEERLRTAAEDEKPTIQSQLDAVEKELRWVEKEMQEHRTRK